MEWAKLIAVVGYFVFLLWLGRICDGEDGGW